MPVHAFSPPEDIIPIAVGSHRFCLPADVLLLLVQTFFPEKEGEEHEKGRKRLIMRGLAGGATAGREGEKGADRIRSRGGGFTCVVPL